VVRKVIRHSGAPVSDLELELSDSDSLEPLPSSQLKTLARSKPSHIVSEPKHPSAAKQFRSTTNVSFAAVGDFLQQKAAIDKERLEFIRKREARREEEAVQRREEEEKLRKADMAKMVLSMNAVTDEVKAAANDYLLSLFKR